MYIVHVEFEDVHKVHVCHLNEGNLSKQFINVQCPEFFKEHILDRLLTVFQLMPLPTPFLSLPEISPVHQSF